MSAVAARHPCIEALLAGYEPPRGGHSWLDERRARALERANALSVPTPREEAWRFTDLAPLTRVAFRPAAGAGAVTTADIARYVVPEAANRLVFVDGVYAPDLSKTGGLPEGVVVSPLAAALGARADRMAPVLAQLADFEHDVFAALNTAHLRDGAFIWIARERACHAPVQVLHVATQREAVCHPRCLVIVERGAQCTLIEDFVSLPDVVHFTNAVTEVSVGEGARLQHVRLQREAVSAFHIARCAAVLERDAHYASHSMTTGARLSRLDLSVLQAGEGITVRLDGLAVLGGRQLADTHSFMDHARPGGRCEQSHKCIVSDAAHAVFNGRIMVRPGAQRTDSAQQSRNLLLSPRAHVDAKPQLEIFADDVKCAHGATVGQLDPEQVFYLTSRGLSAQRARNLLTYAFAAELVDRIPVPSLVAQLEQAVLEQTQVPETA